MAATDARLLALRDVLPGRVLRGTQGASYYLRERLGEGGQGWVFAANWNEPDGYRVVVKVLRPDVVNAEALARFEREASALRLLGQAARPNPYVVRYFDHAKDSIAPPGGGEPTEISFTVIECVSGPTLEQTLAAQRGAALPLERTRRIAGHIALALADVHAHNIVHRDLKPSNVLLATEGGVETAKVTDFGLVKATALGFGRTVALAGATLGYAPPEQFERGNDRVSARTDVFSYAAMLYEMLTGTLAFPWSEGENPLVIVTRLLNGPRPSLTRTRGVLAPELVARPDLVEKLDALVAKATAAEPGDRPATVAEFWGAMERLLRAALEKPSAPPPPMRVAAPTPPPLTAVPPSLSSRSQGLEIERERIARESGAPPPEESRVRIASPASWYWRVRTQPLGPGKVSAAAVDVATGQAFVSGPGGFLAWHSQGWSWVTPAPTDPGAVRGMVWLRPGEVLAFGARGYIARIQPGAGIDIWAVPHRDVTFHAAYVDASGTVTLVGDRPARTPTGSIGVVAQFARGQMSMLTEVHACSGLRGVAQLASGAIIACGTGGSLVRLEASTTMLVGAICAGHLLAIAPLPDGGAVTVGAGGHALSLTPRLAPQLEAVQTTRDLLSLAVDQSGVAWAGSAQARLLRRSGGSWVRMSGELGLVSSVVALGVGPHSVKAVCDDGAVIEGAVVSG
jgi:serine/threonine-protein kinase